MLNYYNLDPIKFLSNLTAQVEDMIKNTGPRLSHLFFVINIIALIFISIIVILIIIMIKKAKERKEQNAIKFESVLTKEEKMKEHYKNHWNEILKHLDSVSENDLKFAIIEADKLIDDILKEKGYQGATISERLSWAKKEIPSLEQLWQAHKLRNRIVHEANFRLTREETQKAIQSYEKALKEMKILQ